MPHFRPGSGEDGRNGGRGYDIAMIDIVFDCLRVAHMAAFAVGIGGAAFLELHLTKRVYEPIDAETLRLIDLGHELIKVAVLGLWMTGLGLLFFRLQIYDGVFSAKLGAKLLIVSGLTVNMLVIQQVALPTLRQFEGRGYADMPTGLLGRLGAIAGFSAGTWVSALLLGGIGRFKTADLVTYGDPAKLTAMRAIKAALDPAGIMNPGAVLSN